MTLAANGSTDAELLSWIGWPTAMF